MVDVGSVMIVCGDLGDADPEISEREGKSPPGSRGSVSSILRSNNSNIRFSSDMALRQY
jgi:hypothetical protein